jgi:hypothetical protein
MPILLMMKIIMPVLKISIAIKRLLQLLLLCCDTVFTITAVYNNSPYYLQASQKLFYSNILPAPYKKLTCQVSPAG